MDRKTAQNRLKRLGSIEIIPSHHRKRTLRENRLGWTDRFHRAKATLDLQWHAHVAFNLLLLLLQTFVRVRDELERQPMRQACKLLFRGEGLFFEVRRSDQTMSGKRDDIMSYSGKTLFADIFVP